MYYPLVSYPTAAIVLLTWDPLDKSADMSLANGNLDAINLGNNTYNGVQATVGKSTGKWYIAWKEIASRSIDDIFVGLRKSTSPYGNDNPFTGGYSILWRGGGTIRGASSIAGTSYTVNDTMEMAVDTDTRSVWMRKNGGAWIGGGDPTTGTSATMTWDASAVGVAVFPIHVTDNSPADTYNVRIQGNASNQDNAAPSGFTPWGD